MAKIKVAKLSELQENQGKLVNVNEKEIALFKSNNQFFAVDNMCLHMGGSLSEGEIEGNNVTCPLHGWQFDLKSGQNIMPGMGKINTYKITVEKDEIFIEI